MAIRFLVCEGDQIKEKYNLYIKWPNLKVSKGAAEVTGFDPNIVKEKGREPKEVLAILESYLYDPEYLSIFHNGISFDLYLHNIFRKNLGLSSDYSYLLRCIDTHALAKGIKTGNLYTGPIGKDFLTWQYKMLSFRKKGLKTSLTTLGRENNIEFLESELHSGLNDCILLFNIWHKWIKWNIEIWT